MKIGKMIKIEHSVPSTIYAENECEHAIIEYIENYLFSIINYAMIKFGENGISAEDGVKIISMFGMAIVSGSNKFINSRRADKKKSANKDK